MYDNVFLYQDKRSIYMLILLKILMINKSLFHEVSSPGKQLKLFSLKNQVNECL